MPTTNPTGYETYIYTHRQYTIGIEDNRQYRGKLHEPKDLPKPEKFGDDSPYIMIEPSYAFNSDDVFIMIKGGTTLKLSRIIAEQLRDALERVCQKPKQTNREGTERE